MRVSEDSGRLWLGTPPPPGLQATLEGRMEGLLGALWVEKEGREVGMAYWCGRWAAYIPLRQAEPPVAVLPLPMEREQVLENLLRAGYTGKEKPEDLPPRLVAWSQARARRVGEKVLTAMEEIRLDGWVQREILGIALWEGALPLYPLRWWEGKSWRRMPPPETPFPMAVIPPSTLRFRRELRPGEAGGSWTFLSPLPPMEGYGRIPHPAEVLAPYLGWKLAEGVAEGKGEALWEARRRAERLAFWGPRRPPKG